MNKRISQARLYEIMQRAVTEDDWKKITAKAIDLAQHGHHQSREWLSRYLLPDPKHLGHLTVPQVSLQEVEAELQRTRTQLAEIVAQEHPELRIQRQPAAQ